MAVAEILVLCGFFMIYIVEEVTHLVVHRMHSQKKVSASDVSALNLPNRITTRTTSQTNLFVYEG